MVIKKKRVEIRAIYILLIFAILFLAISPIMSKADDPIMSLPFKDEIVYESVVNKCTEEGISILTNDPNTKTITMYNTQLARITELKVDGLNGEDRSEIDISDIGLLNYVTELTITNAIIDMSKLSSVTSSNVTKLAITNSTLSHQENLSILTNLKSLDLSNDGISNLSPISGLTQLEELNISYNPIADISRITTLTSLKSLIATSANITSLQAFVPQMTGLLKLYVDINATTDQYPNTFTDIAQLANLTGLQILKIDLKSLDSLETIVQLPLTYLSMKNCNLNDTKIALLSELTTLTSLDLGNKVENGQVVEQIKNTITSLEPLENLTHLQYLNVQNNAVVHVEPISSYPNVSKLYLNGNKIGDVSSIDTILHYIDSWDGGGADYNLKYQVAEGTTKTGVIDFLEIFTNERLKQKYNITTPGRFTTENCIISNNNKITLNGTANEGTVSLLDSDNNLVFTFHITRDTTAPTITRITTDPAQDVTTNETVTVTVEVNEEVQEVPGWELSYNKKVLTREYSNNVVDETITVTDLAGNTSSDTFSIQNIDNDNPIVKVTYNPAEGVTKQVIVTIQSQPLDTEDPTSAKKLAPLEGWNLSQDKLTLTKTYTNNTDGIETLTISDVSGNEIEQDIYIQNIDNSLPILESVTTNPEEPGQTVTVTLTFNEKIQDVDGWTKVNDFAISKQYDNENVNNVEQSVNVKDLVGNQATCTFTINNVDRTAPIVEGVTYQPATGSTKVVRATIRLNENVQAPNGWTLGDDLKSVYKDFTENTDINIKVKDIAGNESAATRILITNVDNDPPVVTATDELVQEGETVVGVKVTLTGNEKIRLSTNQEVLDGSGEENPNEGWINKEDGTVEKTFTKNVSQRVYLEDMVGNQVMYTVTINGINEKIESVEYIPDQNTMTNIGTTVVISANCELELPTGWEYDGLVYADDNDASVDKTRIIKHFTDNTDGEQQLQITTKSGNILTATYNVNNIDKVAPIAEVSYNTTARATEVIVMLKDRNSEKLREKEGWSLSADQKTLTKVYTENVIEQATITDLAGNESEPVEIRVANIDDEEGLDVNVTYERVQNGMKVTITANKQLQTISGWTLSNDKYHLEKVYTTEVTNEEVRIYDINGNQVTRYITVDLGDTEPPTIQESRVTNADSSITVTLRANEEIQRVDGWNLGSDSRSLSKTFTQSTTEDVVIKDIAGNAITHRVIVTIVIDEFSIVQVTYSTTLPTNSDVTATIKTNKELESVSGWTVLTDGKSISKVFTSNGAETVTLTSTEGDTLSQLITVTNIDKSAPQATVTYTTGTIPVTATITANETIQEVEGWQISSDRKKLTKEFSENATETVTIKDLANNSTNVTVEVDISAPPVEDLIATVTYSTTVATNGNVIATITANKEVQELNNWTRSENKKVLTREYTSNVTDTVTITSTDGQTVTKEVVISNIDKTAPVVELSLVASEDNKSVTAIISSGEEIQAVEGWTLSNDRKSISKIYTASANETVEVKDLAGNTSTATVNVTISGNNGGNSGDNGGGNSGGNSGNNGGSNNGGNSSGGSSSNSGGSSSSKGSSSSSSTDNTTASSSIPKTGESFKYIGFILLGICLVVFVWTRIQKNKDIEE